jgi:hypothetical protein
MRHRAKLFIVSLACLSQPAIASGAERRSDSLVSAIAACTAIPMDQRLACYERSTGDLLGALDRREIRVVDREALQSAKRSLFGFSLPHLNLFGTGQDDPRAATDTDVKEITSTVTSLRRVSYGLWGITLAEGGEWQTLADSPAFDPRKGDTITIKAAMLGRYTARIGSGRAVDVKRLR